MASSGTLKLTCMVVLMCMVMVAPMVESLSCGQVAKSMGSCTNYLKKGGALPPACCNGVRSLNSAARSTPDRQAVCICLKSAAQSISGINLSLAAGLPGKCGVNIPYKISPSTDCNRSNFFKF